MQQNNLELSNFKFIKFKVFPASFSLYPSFQCIGISAKEQVLLNVNSYYGKNRVSILP